MKKIIFLFTLLFFISCNNNRNKTTGEQLMKIKQGMHYNEVQNILQTRLTIYDVESQYFKIRVKYRVDWDTQRYGFINFNRKDSLVVNMH